MSVYQKACMLAGQFLTVLNYDPYIERGTVVVRGDGVYINPSDGSKVMC
jgi:hypothetical protein